MSVRLDIEQLRNIVRKRGGQLITDNYINNHTPLDVCCDKGHIWHPTAKSLVLGRWCSVCYNSSELRHAVKRKPEKITEAQQIAQQNGGVCLSTEYINNRVNLRFKCRNNHEWETDFKTIKRGSWCPKCKNSEKINSNFSKTKHIRLNELQQIATDRGGKLLSPEYNGAHTKLKWECACGYEWDAKPNSIKNGSWCPECAGGFSERVCRAYFEALFGERFIKYRPDWLRINGQQCELDGFCEKFNLAFEHHGTQHYQFSKKFFIDEIHFQHRQEYDIIKEKLCNEHNVQLIVIRELFIETQPEDIINIINEKYGPTPFSNIYVNINKLRDNNFEKQRLFDDILEICKLRNGKCLSVKYKNSESKLIFQCECEHIWKATPNAIKNGTWCPKCAHKIPIAIEQMQEIAIQRGGKCLSTEYINNSTKLLWQCGVCDNIWEATYNAIQRGDWCPPCGIKRRADKKRLGIEVYQKAAEIKGGKCLSSTVNSCFDKLEFECAKGHRWFARADQIKNTEQWCPSCIIINRKK